MEIIKIENLSKRYSSLFKKNEVLALNDVSLSIQSGTIFGLLGQNGAGKTTLIKILLGIIYPTSGKYSLLEESENNYHIKRQIGYLPENHKFPNFLNAYQVLNYFGRLSGLGKSELKNKIFSSLELVGLKGVERKKIKTYSKGMMQRLGLAQSLINNPNLIFLDEPTDGVDPIGRKEIRDILVELKNQNKTVFLNSHILSEVELITDSVAILHKGKLVKQGKVTELTARENEYRVVTDLALEEVFSVEELTAFKINKQSGFSYLIPETDETGINRFIDAARDRGVNIKELNQQKRKLEEIFVSLVEEIEGKK